MRDRLLGHRAEPALTIRMPRHRRPICRSGWRRSRRARRSAPRRSASAITSMRLPRLLHRLRQDRPSHPRPGLSQGHGSAGAEISRTTTKRRSSTRSRSTSRPRPNDKTYANQLKGAAILEPIFRRQPRHPGVAHYLIHLYDTPTRARRDSMRRGATRRSRRRRRTPSTCRRTSSPASATGRSRSASNIESARAAKAGKEFDEQTARAWTTWSTPICRLAQDEKARGRRR